MRRHFALSEGDLEFLEGCGLQWEAVIEGGVKRVILHAHPLPLGYKQTHAAFHFRLEGGYPDTQIDMVYFDPPLERDDKIAIRATAAESFDGKTWQRWSRHRTPVNPWRVGIDDISTQVALVEEWLKQELKKP